MKKIRLVPKTIFNLTFSILAKMLNHKRSHKSMTVISDMRTEFAWNGEYTYVHANGVLFFYLI